MTDHDYQSFIDTIHQSSISVSQWEFNFITSNAMRSRPRFSPRQAAVVDKLIEKYADALDWFPESIPTQEEIPF